MAALIALGGHVQSKEVGLRNENKNKCLLLRSSGRVLVVHFLFILVVHFFFLKYWNFIWIIGRDMAVVILILVTVLILIAL